MVMYGANHSTHATSRTTLLLFRQNGPEKLAQSQAPGLNVLQEL
jgi:hypothetical protein